MKRMTLKMLANPFPSTQPYKVLKTTQNTNPDAQLQMIIIIIKNSVYTWSAHEEPQCTTSYHTNLFSQNLFNMQELITPN